jgi:hypothetical protein
MTANVTTLLGTTRMRPFLSADVTDSGTDQNGEMCPSARASDAVRAGTGCVGGSSYLLHRRLHPGCP